VFFFFFFFFEGFSKNFIKIYAKTQYYSAMREKKIVKIPIFSQRNDEK